MEPGAASAKYVGGQLEATAAAAAVRPRPLPASGADGKGATLRGGLGGDPCKKRAAHAREMDGRQDLE